jgi:hypothetical protein
MVRGLLSFFEFGRAAKGVKLIRSAFHPFLDLADASMTGRLTRALLRVIRADTTHTRGSRLITHGDIHFLDGFEFYPQNFASSILPSFYTMKGSDDDTFIVRGDTFHPTNITIPPAASHVQCTIAYTIIDFAKSYYSSQYFSTPPMSCAEKTPMPYSQQLTIPANATGYLLVGVGLRFFIASADTLLPVHSKNHTGFRIIHTHSLGLSY